MIETSANDHRRQDRADAIGLDQQEDQIGADRGLQRLIGLRDHHRRRDDQRDAKRIVRARRRGAGQLFDQFAQQRRARFSGRRRHGRSPTAALAPRRREGAAASSRSREPADPAAWYSA